MLLKVTIGRFPDYSSELTLTVGKYSNFFKERVRVGVFHINVLKKANIRFSIKVILKNLAFLTYFGVEK